MAFNVPAYETGRFSFGPGVLYLGAAGATPTVDIGQVKGDAELLIQRVSLEVKSGSPQSLIKKFAVEENIQLRVTGIEWDFDNMSYALGAGITGISGTVETLEFGGDIDHSSRAVRFVHRTPDGSTIDIHLFNAEGSGEITVAMKETDIHEFPFQFDALEGTVDFENVALADSKKKFKIIRTAV